MASLDVVVDGRGCTGCRTGARTTQVTKGPPFRSSLRRCIMPAVPHTLSEVLMRAFSLSTCLLLSVAPAIHAQAAPAANPLHWGPAPAVFPKGARMAVVSGDPSKAAPFVRR